MEVRRVQTAIGDRGERDDLTQQRNVERHGHARRSVVRGVTRLRGGVLDVKATGNIDDALALSVNRGVTRVRSGSWVNVIDAGRVPTCSEVVVGAFAGTEPPNGTAGVVFTSNAPEDSGSVAGSGGLVNGGRAPDDPSDGAHAEASIDTTIRGTAMASERRASNPMTSATAVTTYGSDTREPPTLDP